MFIRWTRRARRDDQGMALAGVLGIAMVITLLMVTVLSLSTSGATKVNSDRNFQNAIAAAYAGLADYQSRVTANNGYAYLGVTTGFNSSTSSSFTGTGSNPAFGTGAGGTWATVPNSGGLESYRYEVDNSSLSSQGIIRVRVTGRAGNSVRALVATLRGTGFINYLYFTDYESADPDITGETQNANSALPCIPQHLDDPTYNSNTACDPVQFFSGDVLGGPVRTNDEFTICGATFQKQVQSTANDGVFSKPNGCANPTFTVGSASNVLPEQVGSLDLPATNADMLNNARTDQTAPGCLYTGPTSITLLSNGNMTVVSPWTRATQFTTAGVGVTGGATDAECGSISALHSAAGATVPVPPNNLIYVQNVPSLTTDPNYWASASKPASPAGRTFCQSGATYSNGLVHASDGLTYPATNEYVPPAGVASIYGCRNGDVFVEGTLKGALTIGSQNFVYVTGNIAYSSSTSDILGLVGQEAVTVWNPIRCLQFSGSTCSTSSGKSTLLERAGNANISISAAIASNTGTFQLQNYAYGARLGTLTVSGSITQKYRGIVGVTYNGYITGVTKAYGYDARLQSTAPPKFLKPVTVTYQINTQVETTPGFNADGSVH